MTLSALRVELMYPGKDLGVMNIAGALPFPIGPALARVRQVR